MNISKQYFTGQKTQNPQCSYHNQIQIGIGHGFGKRQPWSFNLQKIMQSEGVKVWNEPIDESGKFPDAEKWSETLQLNIEKNSSWILHSASGIAFLDAMLKVNIQIQDIYFVAVWLQDPKFPNGSLGARMFNRQGKYYLQPFLDMADNFRNRFKDIQKLICGNIHIFQSDNDPYVEQSQARYIQNNIGGEILLLSNRGHFEGRKNNPINDTFPEIFERLKKSERHETKI